MSKLDIKIYPDKILRKKAEVVGKIGERESSLAYDMLETMLFAKGIGIAAPQVGVNKRIIVVGHTESNESELVLINPKVLKKKGRASFCEGCLSVPGVTSDIVRPEWILVTALNLEGKDVKIETGGLLARIIQHEIDHLDGVLFIDRVNFLKRRKILKEISSKVCVEL